MALALVAPADEVTVTVESGTKTLAAALADDGKTLGSTDDLVKLGAGTLDLGALPDYAGNIHVKEGIVYATQTNAFGTSAGWTKVYSGAQIQTYTNVTSTLTFYNEQFFVEGEGPDGKGAIRCLATAEQRSGPMPLGNRLTLTGDATLTSSCRHDLMGLTDLGGHTLTLKGSFSYEGSTTTNGNVVQSGGTAIFPTQCKFPGGPSYVYTLTNDTVFCFCWSVLNNVTWTLDVADARLNLYNDGQDNCWGGPVILRKMTRLTSGGTSERNATVRFPKKVTGPGGFTGTCAYQELRLSNADNDFQGGVTLVGGCLRLDADGALPRDGGRLVLTNSTLAFKNVSVCSLPSAEFNGTGVVGKCAGSWKDKLVKSGDGMLAYDGTLESDLLDVQGGSVRFRRSALAGLNAGTRTYDTTALAKDAYATDLLVTNNVSLNLPLMETSGWNVNVLVTYDGYIWNTTASDVTWTWHCCIDDGCDVWIDGTRMISQNGWQSIVTTNLTLTPGPHRFIVRAYNGTGGSGASNANGAWTTSAGENCNTKGLAVDRSGNGSGSISDAYACLADPGDGTLFTTRRAFDLFRTIKCAAGASLDFDGMPSEVDHLIGFACVSNTTLTVNRDWTFDGTALKAGAVADVSGKVVFASGSQIDVSDTDWGKLGNSGLTLLVAEGGIDGLPALKETVSRYNRRIEKSADGKRLVFYAASGLIVIVR